jgi:hypothetical protein
MTVYVDTGPAVDTGPVTADTTTVTIKLPTLLDTLATLKGAVGTGPAIAPCAGRVLIEVTDTAVTFTATDNEQAITVTPPVSYDGPDMRLAVPLQELTKLLPATTTGVPKKKRDELMVRLEFTGNVATVTVNGYTVPLEEQPEEATSAYPDWWRDLVETAPVACVDRAALAEAVDRVTVALSTDMGLPILCGMLLQVTQFGVRMECCDRFRATRATVTDASLLTNGEPLVVLGAFLQNLMPRLEDKQVTFTLADTAAAVKANGLKVTETSATVFVATCGVVRAAVRLMETVGQVHGWPKMDQHFAKGRQGAIVVDRERMAAKVVRAAAIAKAKKSPRNMVALVVDGATVRVEPEMPDHAELLRAPELPAEVIHQPPARRAIQYGYLQDLLRNFSGQQLTLHWLETGHGAILATDSEEDYHDPCGYRHMVMAMRDTPPGGVSAGQPR